jgi:hypothetical protein
MNKTETKQERHAMARCVTHKCHGPFTALRCTVGTSVEPDTLWDKCAATVFELQDGGDTDWIVSTDGHGLRIELCGESELRAFVEALEWAAQTLRAQAGMAPSDATLQDRQEVIAELLTKVNDPDAVRVLLEQWGTYQTEHSID